MKYWTIQELADILHEKIGSDYDIISWERHPYVKTIDFVLISHQISIIHNVCGTVTTLKSAQQLLLHKGKIELCATCRKSSGYVKKEVIRKKKLKYDETSFREKLSRVRNGEYSLVGKYSKTSDKTTFRHNTCGYEWDVVAMAMVGNSHVSCPECNRKNNMISTYEMTKRVNEHTNGEYSLLSKYHGINSPITIKHETCGKIYDVRASFWDRGNRCPRCSRGKQNIEDFLYKNNDKNPNFMYEIVEFDGYIKPCKVVCKKCNRTISVSSGTILSKMSSCPECNKYLAVVRKNEKEKQDIFNYKKYVKSLSSQEFPIIFLDVENRTASFRHICGKIHDTKGTKTKKLTCDCKIKHHTKKYDKPTSIAEASNILCSINECMMKEYEIIDIDGCSITIKHLKCGNTFNRSFSNAYSKTERSANLCPECGPGQGVVVSQEDFKNKINTLFGDNYQVLSKYSGGEKPVLVRHKCGHELYTTWKSLSKKFNAGSRGFFCEKCVGWNASTGERTIKRFFDKVGIVNEEQYSVRFKNQKTCPSKYDFAVFSEDSMVLLIEFDGKQHHEAVEFFGGDKSFIRQKKIDRRKDLYAWIKGIPLLRIPYWEIDNIERILTDKLVGLGLLRNVIDKKLFDKITFDYNSPSYFSLAKLCEQ